MSLLSVAGDPHLLTLKDTTPRHQARPLVSIDLCDSNFLKLLTLNKLDNDDNDENIAGFSVLETDDQKFVLFQLADELAA